MRCDADRWSKQLDPLSVDASFMCASSAKNVNKRGLIPKKKRREKYVLFSKARLSSWIKKEE